MAKLPKSMRVEAASRVNGMTALEKLLSVHEYSSVHTLVDEMVDSALKVQNRSSTKETLERLRNLLKSKVDAICSFPHPNDVCNLMLCIMAIACLSVDPKSTLLHHHRHTHLLRRRRATKTAPQVAALDAAIISVIARIGDQPSAGEKFARRLLPDVAMEVRRTMPALPQGYPSFSTIRGRISKLLEEGRLTRLKKS